MPHNGPSPGSDAPGSTNDTGPAADLPFAPPYIRYVAQRFAEATGVAPTLEKPHRGRIQLRHKVGSWELLLVWSRKRSGGWTTQWQPTLTHNGERRPLFAGLTSYTTAVSALPSCPPTVEVVQAATEIPDTVRAQRDREIAADSAHEWVIRAGRVGNRWVVASVGQEIIAHWYFVERDGQWLRDPLDPLALWDDVGECTTELMPLLRRQFAQPTDGTSRELLSGWRATRAPTPAPTLSPVPGSSVNVRLRL